jgi:hypothetical protein
VVLCLSLAAGEDSGQPHERIAASSADASAGSGTVGYSGSSKLIRRSRELLADAEPQNCDGFDDVRVEFGQILGRDPVLQDRAAADLMDLVSVQEGPANAEAVVLGDDGDDLACVGNADVDPWTYPHVATYLVGMDELVPEDFAAAAAVHRELGPEYSDAVVESFFEKVDREIGARIEARLASVPERRRREAEPVAAERRSVLTGVKIGIAVAGVPLSLVVIAANNANGGDGNWLGQLLTVWSLIAAIYVVGAVRHRRSSGRR